MNEIFFIRFIFRINYGEGHGLETLEETERCLKNVKQFNNEFKLKSSISVEERETLNLSSASRYLTNIAKSESDVELKGLLECSILQEVHKRIFEGLKLPFFYTPSGKFSNERRFTQFRGEEYEYLYPPDMNDAVAILLDRYNSLFTYVKSETDELTSLYDLFKTCAVLVFEFLDLHPFSDGNGRLAQLLSNYCLSIYTPFCVSIYNIWNDLNKEDYIQVLVDTRKSSTRHPDSLVTMLIECYWAGWKNYLKTLQNYQ